MPMLQKLHWLPVLARIKYKITMITSENLHSIRTDLLSVPETKSAPTNITCRAYSYVAPVICNSLPVNLQNLR